VICHDDESDATRVTLLDFIVRDTEQDALRLILIQQAPTVIARKRDKMHLQSVVYPAKSLYQHGPRIAIPINMPLVAPQPRRPKRRLDHPPSSPHQSTSNLYCSPEMAPFTQTDPFACFLATHIALRPSR
jgi:hypothetical protein